MEVELPDGYSLIAVASEDPNYFNYSNYYFMQPNIMIGDGGIWSGNNCQLSEKGIWNMSVLIDNAIPL